MAKQHSLSCRTHMLTKLMQLGSGYWSPSCSWGRLHVLPTSLRRRHSGRIHQPWTLRLTSPSCTGNLDCQKESQHKENRAEECTVHRDKEHSMQHQTMVPKQAKWKTECGTYQHQKTQILSVAESHSVYDAIKKSVTSCFPIRSGAAFC